MYDIDCDKELVSVNLTYLTGVEQHGFTGGWLKENEILTSYPQRGEGFPETMEAACEFANNAIGGNLSYEITPHTEKSHYHGPWPAPAWMDVEEKGYTLSMTGTKDQIDLVLVELADADYGTPERNALLAEWTHPIQSVKGHYAAKERIGSLEETYQRQFNRTERSTPEKETTTVEITFERT
ncbi:MAG: hypothetical protein QGG50_04550 [Methanopyri archaeon]|jgi:hypothetical protein|nr:hypothetical protein [Methanopyri archaeon]